MTLRIARVRTWRGGKYLVSQSQWDLPAIPAMEAGGSRGSDQLGYTGGLSQKAGGEKEEGREEQRNIPATKGRGQKGTTVD